MENNKLQIQQISEHLVQYKDNKEDFLKVFKLYCYIFFTYTASLFTYAGSKDKMKEELNEVYDELYADKYSLTGKGYDTFIDLFGGGFNSTLALMDSLMLSNVKNYIYNDIDSVVCNTHKMCKEQSNEMIEEFSEIIRTKYIIPHGTIFLDRGTAEKVKSQIVDEFDKFQNNGIFDYRLAVRFIYLRETEYSGSLKYYKDGRHKLSKKIFDMIKGTAQIFRVIPKIEKFHKLYNQMNVKFYNMNAFELLELKEFKDNKDCLVNLDPPYIQQDELKFTEDELCEMSSSDLKDCKINYKQPNFPHIELLQKFSDLNFIYNNNSHQIVDFYLKKIDGKKKKFNRKETVCSQKDKKVKIVEETIAYKNSLIHFYK